MRAAAAENGMGSSAFFAGEYNRVFATIDICDRGHVPAFAGGLSLDHQK
jgi:hypothetical protein